MKTTHKMHDIRKWISVQPLLHVTEQGGNVPLVLGSAQANAAICDDGTCPTLTSQMGTGGNNMPLVLSGGVLPHVFKLRSGCDGGGKGYLGQDDKSFTLATGNDQYMMNEQRVRKLTPIECERLQGFSDNYTRIPWKGKSAEECPDSPRYKAIGNSWAVPCVRWIGKRIQQELEKNK